MSITEKWLHEHGYTIGPDGGWYKTGGLLQGPVVKPHPCHESNGQDAGKAQGPPSRRRVTITAFKCRLCDPDNLYVCGLINGLRYCGVLVDDSPDHIELVVRQVKVKTKKEERTEIDVTLI